MNYQEFLHTTTSPNPPEGVDRLVKALWHIKKDHWHEAHDMVQEDAGLDAAWIHALLHKIEGDHWNAEYWYRQAGIKNPALSRDEEWEAIARKLLSSSD